MGSKTDLFEEQILDHIFLNSAIADIGNGAGLPAAGAAGSLYVRLYTSAIVVDDSTLGTEAAYTGYTQFGVAVPRTGGGWVRATNNMSNVAAITFDPCTGGSENIRFVAVWKTNTDETLADRIFWTQLDSDLAVSDGITPEIPIGDLDINED